MPSAVLSLTYDSQIADGSESWLNDANLAVWSDSNLAVSAGDIQGGMTMHSIRLVLAAAPAIPANAVITGYTIPFRARLDLVGPTVYVQYRDHLSITNPTADGASRITTTALTQYADTATPAQLTYTVAQLRAGGQYLYARVIDEDSVDQCTPMLDGFGPLTVAYTAPSIDDRRLRLRRGR